MGFLFGLIKEIAGYDSYSNGSKKKKSKQELHNIWGLDDSEIDLMKSGSYEPFNFEEEDLEEDDYYYDDDFDDHLDDDDDDDYDD